MFSGPGMRLEMWVSGFLHSLNNTDYVMMLNVGFLSLRMMVMMMMVVWTHQSNSSYYIRLSGIPN